MALKCVTLISRSNFILKKRFGILYHIFIIVWSHLNTATCTQNGKHFFFEKKYPLVFVNIANIGYHRTNHF